MDYFLWQIDVWGKREHGQTEGNDSENKKTGSIEVEELFIGNKKIFTNGNKIGEILSS